MLFLSLLSAKKVAVKKFRKAVTKKPAPEPLFE